MEYKMGARSTMDMYIESLKIAWYVSLVPRPQHILTNLVGSNIKRVLTDKMYKVNMYRVRRQDVAQEKERN